MGVYKGRRPGTWRVTAGSPQVERIVEGTRQDALTFHARLQLELDASKLSTRVSPSLRDFCTKIYAPHAVTHLASSTWSKVRVYQVATLVRHLGEAKLSSIDVEMVQRYKVARAKEGTSPSSINNELRVLKTIMRHARSTGHPTADPNWKRLPETGERRAKAWTEDEVQRIFEAAANVSRAFGDLVRFLALTGMRKGEAMAAEWSWVDLGAGLLRLPVTDEWAPKSRRWRDVPIPDALRGFLDAERAHPRVMFPAAHGGAYRRFPEGLWRRVTAAAGVTGGPHQLRHTYASHFLQRVPDLQLLADVLGHSSTRVTELYRHLLPGHLGRARNAVQLGSLAGTLAKVRKPQQTGSECVRDTSSVGLCLGGFRGNSRELTSQKCAEISGRQIGLWRSSGDVLPGLARAVRAEAVAEEALLDAMGGAL